MNVLFAEYVQEYWTVGPTACGGRGQFLAQEMIWPRKWKMQIPRNWLQEKREAEMGFMAGAQSEGLIIHIKWRIMTEVTGPLQEKTKSS